MSEMDTARPDERIRDAVVIGGGAAGLSGALLLARAGMQVTVIDSGKPRNATASQMHGFLSREGVTPSELLEAGRAEVAAFGGELIDATVEALSPGFSIRLNSGSVLLARRLLLTTGLHDVLPEVEMLAQRWGRDVLQCPYCHGHEVRGQALGVLATQPASVHQALMVAQWSRDVVLFEHTHELTDPEREQLNALDIRLVPGEVRELVVQDDALCGVRMADDSDVPRTALFVAPRYVANHAVASELGCDTDARGYVAVDEAGATSVPGVWAAGNVVNPRAQVVTAAGDATAAAIALHTDLVHGRVQRAVESASSR